MSALAFLSGLAEGAGEEASKQGEQRRQLKNSNDQALAETIHKRLETDDTLDFPTYQSLRSQEYKLRGIKTGDISQLLQHEKSIWDVAQQHRKSQAPVSDASSQAPQNELPSPMAGITPALPAGPDYQNGRDITTGDLKSQAQVRVQNALNDAAIQKQRQQFQLFKEQTPAGDVDSENGTHYTNTVAMGPNGPTMTRKVDPGRNITGVERGADILARNPKAIQRGGQPIDPSAYYQGTQYANQDAIYDPRTPTTRNRLEVDAGSPTGFSFQAYGPNNEKIGPPSQNAPRPSTYTEHVVNTDRIIQWIDPITGEHREERIPIKTTNTPTAIGGPTGQLPTIPGAPGTAPASIVKKPVPVKSPTVAANSGVPSSDTNINYLTGQVASGDMKLTDIKGDGISKTDKQVRGAVQSNLAALGLDINHPTTGQREVSKRADAALEHIKELEPVLARLGKAHQLGPFSGRINNFLTTTVGVDPTTADGYKKTVDEAGKISGGNGDYTALLVNAKLLQSLLTQVHTSRTSNLVLEKMSSLFDPGKMDLETLQASLDSIKPWLDTYSKFYKRGSDIVAPGVTGNVPNNSGGGSIVDQLLKDHGFTGH